MIPKLDNDLLLGSSAGHQVSDTNSHNELYPGSEVIY